MLKNKSRVQDIDDLEVDIYNTNDNFDEVNGMKKSPESNSYVNTVMPQKNDGISWFEKVCFAIAGMSFQIQFCALGVFSSVFLLNIAKLPPEKNIYILFVSRAVDALKDPIYGYFIDRSKITRWGKLKPWIFIHTPLTAITYSLLWYIPDGFSENQLFAWFLIWQSFYFIISTGARIPHTAMTMYLCSSLHDREIATILRMGFEMFGLLLALGIQGPLVSMDSYCVNSTTVDPFGTTAAFELTSLVPPTEPTTWEKHKYLFISLILNVFYLLGYYMLIIFVKEDIDLVKASEAKKAQETQNISTLTEIKRMFTFKPFVLLCISTICSISLIQMIQNTLQLYFEYGYYKVKYLFNYAIIGLLILSICFVPLWQFLMKKFEKKYLVIVGNLSIVPLLIATNILSEDSALEITIFFLLLILAANCFTSIFLLPWAMLPNVLDEYLLKYENKLDALFYTFYSLGIKILISLFAGLTQLVLSLVDFKTNECYQNNSVTVAVKLLISVGPFICVIIGSVVIMFYPIDNQRARDNSERVKHFTRGQMNGALEMKQENLHYEENLGYVSENNLRL